MKLNNNSAYVLLCLLEGYGTATAIAKQLTNVDIRSIQRALVRLVEMGVAQRSGVRNNPIYSPHYAHLLKLEIPDKIIDDEKRPNSTFRHAFIDWAGHVSNEALDTLFATDHHQVATRAKMSAKELEYLTIELSWKSSSLEGNTYTLLDTQLLLLEGLKAKNKTEFETQMILNHKNAITFIVEQGELFENTIDFKTVEELHRIIGYNLGISPGVRKSPVRISASNYQPLAIRQQLREAAERVLFIINRVSDSSTRALLALALIPYVQIFEDGNKRTGRMLSNAILINTIGRGFSLRKTDTKRLAMAYLFFYEFGSLYALSHILQNELKK